MNREEMIKHYQGLLPPRITVKVERNEDDEGLWAQILELPHCYTQATNATDLSGMITDAIQTHFEVPERVRKDMGYYIPVPKEHLKMEEMFNELISIEQQASEGKEVQATFGLTDSFVC